MAAWQAQLGALEAAEIGVLALSTDPAEKARETVERLGLTFPVAYGLAMEQTASRWGAYYETRRGILHGTGFLLRRDNSVAVACYSSGAIGRLVPDDVLALVRFWDSRERG